MRTAGAASDAPVQRPGRAFAGVFAVTFACMVAVGAVLPVLPRYVHGPLDAGNIAVGVVIGSYAVTGLLFRPVAGRLADRRGRKPAVLAGALIVALSGFLYLLPLGVPGLIAARLALGVGEGTVFTAGSAWIVDLAPPQRRGRVIGLYGLAVWAGLSLGPLIGELLLHASGYSLVWLFAGVSPLIGAAIALRLPDVFQPVAHAEQHPLIAREAVRPGSALALASLGYATVAAFVVLHLEARGVGHGATVFGAFATMVVLTRLIGGDLPDRIGPARVATAAALGEAVGLATLAVAHSLTVALARSAGDGRRLLPPLPLALAGRHRPHPRDPPRRRPRHLHRLLRRRHRLRRAAGRRGGGAGRLRGRLPLRRGDSRRLRHDHSPDDLQPRPRPPSHPRGWTCRELSPHMGI